MQSLGASVAIVVVVLYQQRQKRSELTLGNKTFQSRVDMSNALVSRKRPAFACSAHMAHCFTACTSEGCKKENHAFRQFESLAETDPDFLHTAMNRALQILHRSGQGLKCLLPTDAGEAMQTVLCKGRELLVCHDGCQCACHQCTRLCVDLSAARHMGLKDLSCDDDIINSIGSTVRLSLLMPERQMVELAAARKYFVLGDVADTMADNLRKGLWHSGYMQPVDLQDLSEKVFCVDSEPVPTASQAAQAAFFAYEHRGTLETHQIIVAVNGSGSVWKAIVTHDPVDDEAPLLAFSLNRFARESKLKKKERMATLESPGYLFFLCYLHVRRNEHVDLPNLKKCTLGLRDKKQAVKAKKDIFEYARRLSAFLDTSSQHANKDFMLKLRTASKLSRSADAGSRQVATVGRSIGSAPLFTRTLFKGIPDADTARREVEKMKRVTSVSRFAFSQMDSSAVLQTVAAVECAMQHDRDLAEDERLAGARIMLEESRSVSSESERLLLLQECASTMCFPCAT